MFKLQPPYINPLNFDSQTSAAEVADVSIFQVAKVPLNTYNCLIPLSSSTDHLPVMATIEYKLKTKMIVKKKTIKRSMYNR